LKKVYQNALLIELKKKGLDVIPNKKIMVYNKGENVGDYYADIIVNNTVILELKAAEYIIDQFENQLLNYLKGTNCEIGLLLNFGKKPEFRRKIYENKRKKIEKISFN
jgi:GxxExxY protein